LPIGRTVARLIFPAHDTRYDHASTVVTSKKGFQGWSDIFGDDVMNKRD
jgi:hypothetical protein